MSDETQTLSETSQRTLAKLREIQDANPDPPPPLEIQRVHRLLDSMGKDVVASVFLDERYHELLQHITPQQFDDPCCQWVWATICNYHEKTGQVPTREITRDLLLGQLTEDDPYDEILAVVEHQPGYQNMGYLLETTQEAFAMARQREHYERFLYGEAALQALSNGDFGTLREILSKALATEPTANSEDSYQWVSPLEIKEIAEEERCWLVEGILESNKTFVIGGPQKAFKTAILCDLVVSLATGTDFLGRFRVPQPTTVAFVSAESDETDILPRYASIAKSKGFALENLPADRIKTVFAAPQLANRDEVRALAASAKAQGATVLIIDPMYLTLLRGGETKINAGNRFEMGEVLAMLRDICRENGLTPLLCHHNNKHTSGKMELNDLSYTGLAEFARQSIMIQPKTARTPDGTSTIQMRTHGFARGQVYDVTINEGTWPDITWDVCVHEAAEVIAEAKRTKAEQGVDRLREAMRELAESREEPLFDAWFNKTELRESMGCSSTKINTALTHAIAGGFVEATQEGTRQARYRRIK